MTSNDEPSGNLKAKLTKLLRAKFVEKEPRELNDAIRNRESWVKVFITVFSVLVIGWKLLRTPIELNGPVVINDVLFVGTALFSLGLSAFFYMKSTEAITASSQQMIVAMRELLIHQNASAENVKRLETTAFPGSTVESEPKHVKDVTMREQVNSEKFYEILFSRITLTDIMNYEKTTLDLKFADLAKGLPTTDIEFLLQNHYITNDWLLSDEAHRLIVELTDKFRMKAIG